MGDLYQITFPNGKSYVGITRGTAARRFTAHTYQRTRACAINRAFRKYGANNATLTVLAKADWPYLCEIEQRAIEVLGTKLPHGYNMTDGGEVPAGLTEESLLKMSATHKGKAHHTQPHSAETRAMMSRNRLGKRKNLSPERRAALRDAMLGNTFGCRKQTDTERASRAVSARGRMRPSNTSGIVGVSFCQQTAKWRAHVTLDKKMIHLGRYDSLEEARAARTAGEQKYFGAQP